MTKFGTTVLILIILVGAAVGFLAFACEDDWCYVTPWQKVRAADSYARCVELGFPINKSLPPQCVAGSKVFTDTIAVPPVLPITYKDLIMVNSPLTNATISSPVTVSGEARGGWYFEGSFPVRVYDANGKELGVVPAQAKGEWTTSEYVPFEGSLSFQTPTTETGTIVFQKDNPSGLPEHDDSLTIPIRFGTVVSESGKTATLQGQMSIGPICPVERQGEPCNPTAEMYAARKISVFSSNGKTLIATITPDKEGKFKITLPEGKYVLSMRQSGVGSISGLPATVTIKSTAPVTLSIDVDTGIR